MDGWAGVSQSGTSPASEAGSPHPTFVGMAAAKLVGAPLNLKKESQIYLHPAPSCATPGSAAAKQQPTLLQGSVWSNFFIQKLVFQYLHLLGIPFPYAERGKLWDGRQVISVPSHHRDGGTAGSCFQGWCKRIKKNLCFLIF